MAGNAPGPRRAAVERGRPSACPCGPGGCLWVATVNKSPPPRLAQGCWLSTEAGTASFSCVAACFSPHHAHTQTQQRPRPRTLTHSPTLRLDTHTHTHTRARAETQPISLSRIVEAMRRALALVLSCVALAACPGLASGAALRSEGYYREKFVQVRKSLIIVCLANRSIHRAHAAGCHHACHTARFV